MNPVTNTTPITYDFLEWTVNLNVGQSEGRRTATQILGELSPMLQQAHSLDEHLQKQGYNETARDLITRVVRHHEQTQNTIDPHEQADLDWECLSQGVLWRKSEFLQQAYADGRYQLAFKRHIESLFAQCKSPDELEKHWDDFIFEHILQAAPNQMQQGYWLQQKFNFLSALDERYFEWYLAEALAQQHNAPEGSCLVNLGRFIESRAGLTHIGDILHQAKDDFSGETKEDCLESLKVTLEDICDQICPELTKEDVAGIITGCRRVWDAVGRLDPSVCIWMVAVVYHLAQLLRERSIDQHADYLIQLIYQMRTMAEWTDQPCSNRFLYEWGRVVRLYWHHTAQDDAQRVDLLAMGWKREFCERNVQPWLTLTFKERGQDLPIPVELEMYRGNEVHYDQFLHFGMLSQVIAYDYHKDLKNRIPAQVLFKQFFEEVHKWIQPPNGWVDYALKECTHTRLQHQFPCELPLLINRLTCWLSHQELPLLSSIEVEDAESIHERLLQNRQGSSFDFHALKPHIQSLRWILKSCRNHDSYADTEIIILSHILEIRTAGVDTTEPVGHIWRLVTNLHGDYTQAQTRAVEQAVIEHGHQLGILYFR